MKAIEDFETQLKKNLFWWLQPKIAKIDLKIFFEWNNKVIDPFSTGFLHSFKITAISVGRTDRYGVGQI